MLDATLEDFDLVEWSPTRVVFVNEAPLCAKYTYTIDTATKRVTGLRTRKAPQGNSNMCNDLTPELRPTLVDGYKVHMQEVDAAQPWFGPIVLQPLSWIFDIIRKLT